MRNDARKSPSYILSSFENEMESNILSDRLGVFESSDVVEGSNTLDVTIFGVGVHLGNHRTILEQFNTSEVRIF
jgi:hypothetical protein